jgi:hypothetical protein
MIREGRVYCDQCEAEMLKLTEEEGCHLLDTSVMLIPWQSALHHYCFICLNKRRCWYPWFYDSYCAPRLVLANFFRVRKIYFDALKACTKNEELRKDTPFWRARLLKPTENRPNVAYFTCGNDELYRLISSIVPDVDPEVVLGRPLSGQGRKDIPTPTCIATYLGRVYDR